MVASVKTSGSQTATINTEHTLATVTDAGTYAAAIDLAAMTNGSSPDIVEIRIYGKARSSDAERLIKTFSFMGAQTEPLWESFALLSPHSYKVTLKQTQGTGRSFPWAVYAA